MKKRRTTKSPHVAALQQTIRDLSRTRPEGLRHIFAAVPELLDVIRALHELVEAADPIRGRVIDGGTPPATAGAPSALSADGRSTTEGRATLNARTRLDHWRRQLRNMARAITDDADPTAKRYAAPPRPRCRRTNCPKPNHRQPYGTAFCMHCGEPMGAAKGGTE